MRNEREKFHIQMCFTSQRTVLTSLCKTLHMNFQHELLKVISRLSSNWVLKFYMEDQDIESKILRNHRSLGYTLKTTRAEQESCCFRRGMELSPCHESIEAIIHKRLKVYVVTRWSQNLRFKNELRKNSHWGKKHRAQLWQKSHCPAVKTLYPMTVTPRCSYVNVNSWQYQRI